MKLEELKRHCEYTIKTNVSKRIVEEHQLILNLIKENKELKEGINEFISKI